MMPNGKKTCSDYKKVALIYINHLNPDSPSSKWNMFIPNARMEYKVIELCSPVFAISGNKT
jgi:hypothetical protein